MSCALGATGPSGARRSTYSDVADPQQVGEIRMPAGKLLDRDSSIDAGNFAGKKRGKRFKIKLLAMTHGGGIGGHEILL